MAVVYGCGWEFGAAYATLNAIGTYSFSSTTVRSGTYSLRTNPTTTGTGYLTMVGPGVGIVGVYTTTSYHRFYFRYGTKPASGDEEFFNVLNSSNQQKLCLRLNSSGQIAAYDSAASLLATGTTALSANTWYRIEVQCGTGTSANWEVRINGVSEISGTGNLRTDQMYLTGFGKRTDRDGNSVDFYFDDWLYDDAAYPPDGAHILLVPDSNGTYQTFSIGAGSGSHYQVIDEIPPDGSTSYLLSTGTVGDAETEGLQSCATAGISGTINAVFPIVIYVRNATGAQVKPRVRSGGTNSDGPASSPYGGYSKTDFSQPTDPATGLAWTTSGLDGAEVGAVENATTNQTRVTFVGLMVDFTAGGGGGTIPTPYYRLLAGMGNL